MFTETLKIKPKLDNGDLRKMENSLNARFKRVSKKFGKGMGKLFKGGALLALGTAFVAKMLNPLKEVQTAIDATLVKNDDLGTFAKQFGSESGKFAKLVALGSGSGMSQNDLIYVLTKFQTALGEQKEGRRDVGLANFTGFKDTSEAFLQFMQSMARLDTGKQNVLQKDIFGERQITKMQDLLQVLKNPEEQFKRLGLDATSTAALTAAIEKVAALSDKNDILGARRELKDIITKGNIINGKMVNEINNSKQVALDRLNNKMTEFDQLKHISNQMAEFGLWVEKYGLKVVSASIKATPGILRDLNATMQKINNSPLMRGFNFWGKGK